MNTVYIQKKVLESTKEKKSKMKSTPYVSAETDSVSRNKTNPVRTINGTRHKQLEQEYMTLKRDLTMVPKESEISELKQDTRLGGETLHNGDKRDKVNLVASAGDVESNSREFLVSDALGMDHFKKHILNVKVNSKRRQKVNRQLDKKPTANKKVQSRFKPVFEQGDY